MLTGRRDFVYVEGSRTEPDGSMLSGVVSIEVELSLCALLIIQCDECPPVSGNVRGQIIYRFALNMIQIYIRL